MKPTVSFRHLVLSDLTRLAPGILAQLAGGFVISIILGRYLPPEAMGVYTLFWIAQTHISWLATGWLFNAVIRFLSEDASHLGQYLGISFVAVSITGAAGLAATAVYASLPHGALPWTYLAWTTAVLCAASSFTIFQCVFRSLFKQAIFSINAFMLVGCQIILLLVFLPGAKDLVLTVLTVLAISHIPVLLRQWSIVRNIRIQNTQGLNAAAGGGSLLGRSIAYGLPLTFSAFIITLLQTGDRYFLALLLTLKEVGVYTFWMGLGLQLGKGLYSVIFLTLNPRLFQAYSSNPDEANHYVKYITRLYILTLLPLLTALGFMLPPLLARLKVKPQYFADSRLIFYGMGVAFFLGLSQLWGKRFEFEGRTMIFVYTALAAAAMMIAGIFFFVPFMGMDGAAVAALGAFLVYFSAITIASRFIKRAIEP